MRLKWLPVRLRGRRRVPLVAAESAPARRPSTALHFCGEPANVSCPRPRRASREGGSAPRRGELIARRRLALRGKATEESCESFARRGAGLSRLGPSPSAGRPRSSLRAVGVYGALSGGKDGRTLRRSRWCPDGRIRPVLKHGPRSATCVRVRGWQTRRRNESEGRRLACCGESLHPLGGASSTDPRLRCGGI